MKRNMAAPVKSIVDGGGHENIVEVECQTSNGLPASKSVDEAKELVRNAFASSKLDMLKKRITINPAPADIPKESGSFDLAIATSILLASKQIHEEEIADYILIGELGLDGLTRPVSGTSGKVSAAKKLDISPRSYMKTLRVARTIADLAF